MKFDAKKWLDGIQDSHTIAFGVVIPLSNQFAFNYGPVLANPKFILFFNVNNRLAFDTWQKS